MGYRKLRRTRSLKITPRTLRLLATRRNQRKIRRIQRRTRHVRKIALHHRHRRHHHPLRRINPTRRPTRHRRRNQPNRQPNLNPARHHRHSRVGGNPEDRGKGEGVRPLRFSVRGRGRAKQDRRGCRGGDVSAKQASPFAPTMSFRA